MLVKVFLEPHAPFAQHFAVIRGEDDDGVVAPADPVKRVEQLADHPVEVTDRAVIGAAGGQNVGVVEPDIQHAEIGEKTHGVGIVLVLGKGGDVGKWNLFVRVQVPELLLAKVGFVRVGVRDLEEEGAVVV